jgi:alpha-soluble NSF attachment protein
MGDKFKAEAEKALSRVTIFGFGKQQKYEDASAAFLKAGNAYKMSKDWNEAAEMFLKAAECQKETDSRTDACNSYVEAGGCYAKVR